MLVIFILFYSMSAVDIMLISYCMSVVVIVFSTYGTGGCTELWMGSKLMVQRWQTYCWSSASQAVGGRLVCLFFVSLTCDAVLELWCRFANLLMSISRVWSLRPILCSLNHRDICYVGWYVRSHNWSGPCQVHSPTTGYKLQIWHCCSFWLEPRWCLYNSHALHSWVWVA